MIDIMPFDGPRDWEWVKSHLPMLRVEDTCGVIAHQDGQLVAAAIFDNFTHNTLQGSIIITNPLAIKRGFLQESFDLAFKEADKKYMYNAVAESNKKSLKFCKHLGFVEKMRIKEGHGPNDDYIVMELNRDNCAYYKALDEVA